jgi:hypothetical protein
VQPGKRSERGENGNGGHRFSFEGGSVARGEKEEGNGALRAWPCGEGGGGTRGAVARRSVVQGGRQWPLTVGRGRWHCCVNREGGGSGLRSAGG